MTSPGFRPLCVAAFLALVASSAMVNGQGMRSLQSGADVKAVATAAARAEAMAKHPELGRRGSEFNREFLVRFQRYKTEKPAFFEDGRWPLNLADEVAQSGVVSFGETVISGVQLQGRTAVRRRALLLRCCAPLRLGIPCKHAATNTAAGAISWRIGVTIAQGAFRMCSSKPGY